MSQKAAEKRSPRAHIQVELPDGEPFDPEHLLEQLPMEMRSFASHAGLFVMNELMRLEAEALAGTSWQCHTDIDRWGHRTDTFALGDRSSPSSDHGSARNHNGRMCR